MLHEGIGPSAMIDMAEQANPHIVGEGEGDDAQTAIHG